jgi:hypothetical protein
MSTNRLRSLAQQQGSHPLLPRMPLYHHPQPDTPHHLQRQLS